MQGDRPVPVSGGSQEMVIVSCSGVIVGLISLPVLRVTGPRGLPSEDHSEES